MGSQVVSAIQNFFRDGWLPQNCNHTYITLIPKKQGACNFSQFRPISLCNFFYKIISKILVNRMRPLISKIIDPSQAAFVPHRWIIENVLLLEKWYIASSRFKGKMVIWVLNLIFTKHMTTSNGSLFPLFSTC